MDPPKEMGRWFGSDDVRDGIGTLNPILEGSGFLGKMCLIVAQPTRLPHRCKRNQPAGLVVNDPELVLNGSLYFKWIHSQISHMGIVLQMPRHL